jgi:RND family efflux transporter MFP subunit
VRAGVELTVIVLLVTGLASCDRRDPATRDHGATGVGVEPLGEVTVDVQVAPVRRGQILQQISAPGSLLARRQSRIGPEVRGRIRQVFVSEGDRVEADQPLFEIDRDLYELGVLQAVAALDRTVAQRGQVETDLARVEALRKRDVVAEHEAESLVSALAVASAAVREAEQAVAVARMNLEKTVVRAPYAGSVAKRLADEGTTALVQPQTVVIVLEETHELEAQASIPEIHFAAIRPGDVALLHVEGLPHPIQTEVSAVADTVDPATRTYLVKMPVANPDHAIKAGIFARIDILPSAKSEVIVVPREAVRNEDGRSYALVLSEGRAVARVLQLGVVGEREVEVLHGVRVGEDVVIGEAARTLGPGMPVRVVGREGGASQ